MRLQTYTIVITFLLVVVTQIILDSRVHILRSKDFHPVRRRKSRIPARALQEFCHSDPGIDHRRFHGRTKRNCFGHCIRSSKGSLQQRRAIIAPPVTRLCHENPFHGFYDCIWPLVHYVSTCALASQHRELIIYDSKNISEIRQQTWVIQAQQAFLRNIRDEFHSVDRNELRRCTCFHDVVKFRRKTMWRPLRFHTKKEMGNNTIVSPHPSGLKRAGLHLFRSAVLHELKLNSEPLEGKAEVVIYGREDAFRRRWLNVDHFERRLREAFGTDVEIKRWKVAVRQHDSFEKQAKQMNSAAVVIAPHGAGMVNTLFCRRKTAIIEIASRKCATENESVSLSEAMDVNDENTWTPWHADSLGLVHFAAPCRYSSTGDYDFYTEMEVLVQLVRIALHARALV